MDDEKYMNPILKRYYESFIEKTYSKENKESQYKNLRNYSNGF